MLMRKVIALQTSHRFCKQAVLGEAYQQPAEGLGKLSVSSL